MNKGMVVVLSAPSGCGKDTVFKELCKIRDDVVKSVSATTRKPRKGEVDGVDYYFIDKESFEKLIKNNGLIEYTNYNDCYYGTPINGVKNAIENGKICFLIIEVEGAQNVMRIFPDCISIFLLPPNIDALEHRLKKRGTDDNLTINKRLEIAQEEISHKGIYKYNIVNDELETCVNEINKILCEELNNLNA